MVTMVGGGGGGGGSHVLEINKPNTVLQIPLNK